MLPYSLIVSSNYIFDAFLYHCHSGLVADVREFLKLVFPGCLFPSCKTTWIFKVICVVGFFPFCLEHLSFDAEK